MSKKKTVKRLSFDLIPAGKPKHIVLISEVIHNYFGEKAKGQSVSMRFHKVDGRFIAVEWEPYAREGLLAYVFADYAQMTYVNEDHALEYLKLENFRVDVDENGQMTIVRFGTAKTIKEALQTYKNNHTNKITERSWPQSRALTDLIKSLNAISAEVMPISMA